MAALQGIRVLDLSRVLAGPWSGQILADLGAEVIKVERPNIGDDTRLWGPPWMLDAQGEQTAESGYYQCTNRNKYSIAIDISTPEGQEIIYTLIKTVDVVIENYKVGTLAKYGLDYEKLSLINPRVVYCSITGFGQNGPRAEQAGYDFILQGMSGLMSITGAADAGAEKVGVAVVDLQTGLYATIAIQAALLARQHTGRGQSIDMSLFDVQIAGLANQGMNYLCSGQSPQRMGNAHPNIVPYQTFKASDQEFIIACGNDKQFVDLCHAIGRSDLLDTGMFLKNPDRVKHRDVLIQTLKQHFLTQSAQHWVDVIQARQVPVGMINSIAEAFNEPQTQHREMLVSIPHRLNADFKMVGSPIKLSDTPVQYHRAPPLLGEHTEQILSEFFDRQKIDEFKRLGVIDL